MVQTTFKDTSYVSSEESDVEEENGSQKKVRRVRCLTWESKNLKTVKHRLDSHYQSMLTPSQKASMVPVIKENSLQSNRVKPSRAPLTGWAVAK